MGYGESDTRAKLIDPALYQRGWTEENIRREETAGAMPVTVEECKQRLTRELVQQAPTLEAFRERWVLPASRADLLAALPDGGRSAILVQYLDDMGEFDLYDVLADLAYGLAPRTRQERADALTYKQAPWLKTMPAAAAATVQAIAQQFAKAGTDGLENPAVFQTPEVRDAGGLAALKAAGEPADVVKDTKERMFSA